MTTSRIPFQLPTTVKSFYDYFELRVDAESLAQALGYTLLRGTLALPRVEPVTLFPHWAADLQQTLRHVIDEFPIETEVAKRELLVAPLLIRVALHTHTRLYIEYTLSAGPNLQGDLDYYLPGTHSLLVVEAKKGDPIRGFHQLLAQLAAVDQWSTENIPYIYGAVTLGNVWQFAVLDRQAKTISQDSNVWGFPAAIPDVLAILLGILQNPGDTYSDDAKP